MVNTDKNLSITISRKGKCVANRDCVTKWFSVIHFWLEQEKSKL